MSSYEYEINFMALQTNICRRDVADYDFQLWQEEMDEYFKEECEE